MVGWAFRCDSFRALNAHRRHDLKGQMKIAPPKISGKYPDRHLDCQAALEPVLHELSNHAISVGWSEDEIADAMLELAEKHTMARATYVADKIAAAAAVIEAANRRDAR
jgi:hypothetical protein